MRWFHEGVDRLHVALASRLAPPVFRHGMASPPFHAHLEAVRLELPVLDAGPRSTVVAHTLAGRLEAGFQVRLGSQPALPVLVYHHGIAEMPYDKSFRGIFRVRIPVTAHLVAVRAPFHRSWLDCARGLTTFSRFLAMCAVAVKLGETVRCMLAARGARGSLVAGISLGGFLTLLHHLFYGTADCYVPLLAGPDLAHVMLSTHYGRFLAPQAHNHPARITAQLDFRSAFQASNTHKIRPLIARYDLDMLYAYHAACYAASGVPVVTIDRGHITGVFAFAALRAHVLGCLRTFVPTAS